MSQWKSKFIYGMALACLVSACATTPPPAVDPAAKLDAIVAEADAAQKAGQTDKAHAIDHKVERQAIPPQILSELTVAEKLKEAGFSEVQAAALTRAIEAAATAKAELVEARMNKDLETVVERTNASFEKTVRERTRWIATIVFSAIGLMIAFYGIALHFK